METNAQYVLDDSEATAPAWAARIRLTPELLDKLRQMPDNVRLQLNVTQRDGTSTNCGNSKKTSLMTVRLVDTEEQYELLSFPEDPGINHVCTFRQRVDEESTGGYNIYKTGAIYQKLLVQRLLDDTEKDRIKDKHAQSVLASKSRSSKLIDSKLEQPTKRQRIGTRSLSVRTAKTSTGSSAWSKVGGHKRTKKLVLPSALTTEEAIEAKEKIEKGFEVEMGVPVVATKEKTFEYNAQEDDKVEASTAVVRERSAAVVRDADFHALFSSDSDDEDGGVSALRDQKKTTTAKVKINRSAAIAKENDQSENKLASKARENEATTTVLDTTKQVKESLNVVNASGAAVEVIKLEVNDENVIQDKESSGAMGIYALKPIEASTSEVEVKRARVRSALVSDRVKQSRLPDLSFFPPVVVEICQRVAHYRGRSVILDESDYELFVETHQHFWHDWEMLDKAYSIEMIKTEGLHLQLEMDITDINHKELKARIQASLSKKEGLLFVRDVMASIQKILLRIQTSIDRYDLNLPKSK
ncbi:hypothetical protein KXD40_007142 [Peronospora effusa]|uniref:Uncharacterized protein n=1 Tax=Peronospora effusa TaxID=542832 RepID=A0A3M6VA94_9STRA|nr:hypothetical protein DD238_006862 [Peronospora effusa]UIZ29066.1 hypothetical protein KXD40_007142 [Peronospora effusa]CAI5700752.1 unnamed protein product [Peronospora effusa]